MQRVESNRSVTAIKQHKSSKPQEKLSKVKQVEKSQIKALSIAWRENIAEWTPTHLRIMAVLGFNLLAIQEDVISVLR